MSDFRLATSRYQAAELILASGLRPVGISVGRPKFRLGYMPIYTRELAPWGLLQIEDNEEFGRRYLERLGGIGVELLKERFAAIASEHEASGLVLLCYEPVGENCHRHPFGKWWWHRTGQAVEELQSPHLQLP